MTWQPDPKVVPGSSPDSSQWSTGYRSTIMDESLEGLRRRADVLLDEMMLGGVDMAAGGPPLGPNGDHVQDTPSTLATPASSAPNPRPDTGADLNQITSIRSAHEASGARSVNTAPPAGTATLDTSRRIVAAEARYPQANGMAPSPQPAPPAAASTGFTAGAPALSTAGDQTASAASSGSAETAVRRSGQSAASSMTVGGRISSRSNLLPRLHNFDAEAAHREIVALTTEVAVKLPPNSEAAERSRHLLNKAENILQSGPDRSAEIEYYLQQVRRIIDRTRQMNQWSQAYRRSLTTYGVGWLLLSLVAVIGSLLYGRSLAATTANLVSSLPIYLSNLAPPVSVSAFAGSLGAALALLLGMNRHSRREFGYFDRKYGLRGLLLPLLGLLGGLLMAAVCGLVYVLAGLNPISVWALLLPAALAFLVGLFQDRLFGIR